MRPTVLGATSAILPRVLPLRYPQACGVPHTPGLCETMEESKRRLKVLRGTQWRFPREQVFEVLQRVHPALERGLPGWSVRPNITGTGAVGLYLDGPELPLMGVNLAGEPVARHLCGTVQSADRGLPGELDQVRYQYILGVSVTEREEEYPELTDLPKTGEPSWVNALRVLDQQVLAERRDEFFISRGGYVPGRRALGKRRVALRREFFPGKPWMGLGTIDWCAGVRSTPVYAGELDALASAAVRLASTWDAALRSV